jgi:hypothetical protein
MTESPTTPSGTPGILRVLVPADEDFVPLVERLDEPLLTQVTGAPDEPGEDDWDLPEICRGETVGDAWLRLLNAVRAAVDAAGDWYDPGSRYQLAPLGIAHVAAGDVAALATLAATCERALAGTTGATREDLQLVDLAQVLDGFDGWEREASAAGEVAALRRLVEVLHLGAPDAYDSEVSADARVLLEAAAGPGGVTLSEAQDAAYKRFMTALTRARGGDRLDLWAAGVVRYNEGGAGTR